MRRFLRFFLFLSVCLFFQSQANAQQSDRKIIVEFQARHRNFMESIEAAKTKEDLSGIKKQIAAFREESMKHRALLDKALYPDNFNSSFEKLEHQAENSMHNAEAIGDLKTEVTQLSVQVNDLSTRVSKLTNENKSLFEKITKMGAIHNTDRQSIDSLMRLTSRIRTNMRQRDNLIMEIVDSLFLHRRKNLSQLSEVERNDLIGKAESSNLLGNITRSVYDKIKYSETASFSPEDLAEQKRDYREFFDRWRSIGPRLAVIYSPQTRRVDNLTEIDNLLYRWNESVDSKIWYGVNHEFQSHKIYLDQFSSGTEFVSIINTFIDRQMGRINSKDKSAMSDSLYRLVADSIWNKDLTTKWLPLLLNNRMITANQISSIQAKLAQWHDRVGIAPSSIWIYVIIGTGLMVVIVAGWTYMRRRKPEFDREE